MTNDQRLDAIAALRRENLRLFQAMRGALHDAPEGWVDRPPGSDATMALLRTLVTEAPVAAKHLLGHVSDNDALISAITRELVENL